MESGEALAGGGMFHTTCSPAQPASPTRSLYQVSWELPEQTCGKQEQQLAPETGQPWKAAQTPLPACLPSKVTVTYHIRGTLGKMCHLPQPLFPPLPEDSSQRLLAWCHPGGRHYYFSHLQMKKVNQKGEVGAS